MASESNIFTYYLTKAKTFCFRFDFMQIIPLFTLLAIGVLFIYGTGQQIGIERYEIAYQKQMKWIALGMTVWLTLSVIDYRKLTLIVWPLYTLSIILLTLVLAYGKAIEGAQRWLSIGGFSFQPSELAKLATLLALSWILSRRGFSIKGFSTDSILSIALVGVVTGLQFMLIVIQPDLGTSLVLVALFSFLIFVAGLDKKFIIIVLSAVVSYAAINEARLYFEWHGELKFETKRNVFREATSAEKRAQLYFPMLRGYQLDRILVFLDSSRDAGGRGYNQLQAELAVGSGGTWGKGFMQGTQTKLKFLPYKVSNSDFIFTVIAEEWGFVGATSLVILYIVLIASAIRTAMFARDLFGRYIAIGTTSIFFMHSVVNIGMSIRLAPVTGLPLPFLSYGGTFVVVSLAYMGLLQSIYRQRRSLGARPEIEATKITNTRF